MLNRSVILRAAHAETRRQMQPTREFSYALKWCPERRLYIQPHTYAYVFAYELKKAWLNARPIVATVSKLTAAETADVASLRYFASIEPLNGAGAAAFRAANAKADAILAAASQHRAA